MDVKTRDRKYLNAPVIRQVWQWQSYPAELLALDVVHETEKRIIVVRERRWGWQDGQRETAIVDRDDVFDSREEAIASRAARRARDLSRAVEQVEGAWDAITAFAEKYPDAQWPEGFTPTRGPSDA